MHEFCLPLVTVRLADASRVGRKAAVLGTMLEAGFPVSPGLCLTTAAFRLALRDKAPAIEAILRNFDLAETAEADEAAIAIAHTLASLTVPAQIIAELETQLPRQFGDAALLAVRSSGTIEDQAMASFAGQYSSLLGVIQSQLSEAILVVWRSAFSSHALLTWARQAESADDQAMAILIQPMIEAQCAGVCYSADPVTQNRDRIVINAGWGLGSGVGDGSVATDIIWMQRNGLRLEKQVVREKPEQLILNPAGGIQRAAVPAQQARAACLPSPWQRRIAQFGLAAEVLLGRPQDMEWAITEEQVWVLQSRPISTLPIDDAAYFPVEWQNEQDRRNLWTLTAYSQARLPPRPLEHDDVAVVESIREETCKWLGVDRNGIIKIWNGRAYYRPIPLPLSEADRQVRHDAQQGLQARLQREGLTAWDYWGPEIIEATQRIRSFDLRTAGGWEMADHLERALAVRRRHAMLHPMLWFRPPQSFKVALAAVTGLAGEELQTTAYQLLDGEETPLTQLVDGLFALAMTARQAPEVASLVMESTPAIMDELAKRPAGRRFLSQLQAFLDQYGDRTGNGYGSEATIMTPTWREQPARVARLLSAYMDPEAESPAAIRARAHLVREARLHDFYQACQDKEMIAEFQRQLAYARKSIATLELHNHYIDQMALGQLRQVTKAAADWLCRHEILSRADDIFWLYFDEILAALRDEINPSETEIIERRKQQYEDWAKLEPPLVLGTPAAELPPRPDWSDEVTTEKQSAPNRLLGLGASAGQRNGRARVVGKGEPLPELEPGDILVAENVGPLWTPWFPVLGGLVLETGSLGQHAAATAREYGLPAVIGTKIATLVIPDRSRVSIDGTAGIVELSSS